MIWFVFGRAILKSETGLYRFFTSWGGEALYNSHEEDPETGTALRAIGTACLIEAAVPFSALDRPWGPVQKHFVDRFLHINAVRQHPDDGEFEGYVTKAVGPERVRRVIQRCDREFAAMTGCDSWSELLT